MTKLTEITRCDEAQRLFTIPKLWELFDGDRRRLNVAHECVDRHAASGDAVPAGNQGEHL